MARHIYLICYCSSPRRERERDHAAAARQGHRAGHAEARDRGAAQGRRCQTRSHHQDEPYLGAAPFGSAISRETLHRTLSMHQPRRSSIRKNFFFFLSSPRSLYWTEHKHAFLPQTDEIALFHLPKNTHSLNDINTFNYPHHKNKRLALIIIFISLPPK